MAKPLFFFYTPDGPGEPGTLTLLFDDDSEVEVDLPGYLTRFLHLLHVAWLTDAPRPALARGRRSFKVLAEAYADHAGFEAVQRTTSGKYVDRVHTELNRALSRAGGPPLKILLRRKAHVKLVVEFEKT